MVETPEGRWVAFVRHGAVDGAGDRLFGRRPGVTLNPSGRQQAMRLAASLAALPVAAVWSSPQPRTFETAALIAAAQGVTVKTCSALDEVDFGAWTGCSFADLERDPAWRAFNAERHAAAAPGGESMSHVRARVRRALAALIGAAERPAGNVVLVSHAEIIRCAVLDALGLDANDWRQIRIDPASVTLGRCGDGRLDVRVINWTAGASETSGLRPEAPVPA